MQKVVHLIPYDGIGGVEAAARTMADARHAFIKFRLQYIFPKVLSREDRLHTFNLLQIWKTARALATENPDILIVSLWRSAIAGIIVRLLNPRVKLVLFLHNSADAHGIDYLATRLAASVSNEIWSDSDASLKGRIKVNPHTKQRVISFMAHRIDPCAEYIKVSPKFIYWGRLSAQKNLRRAITIFSQIYRARPDATYLIIGPDGDQAAEARTLVQELGLSNSVRFAGPLSFQEICREARGACFYLQTSLHEGMAMSVVEAMQLGLVPVVTPVGQIARYCREKENGILVDNDHRATEAVLDLLSNEVQFDRLRQGALKEWQNKLLYRESMLEACAALLSKTGAQANA